MLKHISTTPLQAIFSSAKLRALLVFTMILSFAPVANADQLTWVKPELGKQVVAALTPGKVIIYWPCNNPKKQPVIFKVVKVWTEPVQSKVKEAKGMVALHGDLERVGYGTIEGADDKGTTTAKANKDDKTPPKVTWKAENSDGEIMPLDLAYIFVNLRGSLSKFTNLAIALKQKPQLKVKTFQIPTIVALKLRRKKREAPPAPGENRAG